MLHLWSAQVQSQYVEPLEGSEPDEEIYRAAWGVLSVEEQLRAQRCPPASRQQFVIIRTLLRRLLGQYLQQDPCEIQFCYSAHGKPALVSEDARDLSFNLSHSKGTALFAVFQQPVGIDVEWIDPQIRAEAIARRSFSVQEQSELAGLSQAAQQAKFFRLWTRKEAAIKLFGGRLFVGLNRYSVVGQPQGFWLQLSAQESERSGWLQDLAVEQGFAAAFATSTRPDIIQHRRWDWLSS